MSAGKNAIPLYSENPEWMNELPTFICICGFRGKGHELLCENDDDTLWCPSCKTAVWAWD